MSNIEIKEISDLYFVKQKILQELNQNPNRRLSALYGELRKDRTASGIGDWPIMSLITQIVYSSKFANPKQIWRMCNKSNEYKKLKFGEKQKFSKSIIQSINYI